MLYLHVTFRYEALDGAQSAGDCRHETTQVSLNPARMQCNRVSPSRAVIGQTPWLGDGAG